MSTENFKKINGERQKMIADLHAQLEWYTREASEEEFDPKAVESILYLLDIYEPMKEGCVDVDEAWKRFAEKVEAEERATENEQAVGTERKLSSKKMMYIIAFAQKRKVIVAAVLVVLLLALVGTTQAEAIRQSGFFYWLRQDDEGRQMITVPENLESDASNSGSKTYYDRSRLPVWCEELLEIEVEWDVKESLEWKYIDAAQLGNYSIAKSYYIDPITQEELAVGGISYVNKVTLNTEVFGGYSYMESIGDEVDSVYVYSKLEESGDISYRICEFAGSNVYFVEGKNLEMLKEFFEKN